MTAESFKPSDRIEQIRKDLIWRDYIAFGGNTYLRAQWMDLCNQDDRYQWMALFAYLDESKPPPNNPDIITNDLWRKVMAQREQILEAFIAQYGLKPDEIEQVQDGLRWYVRKREPTLQSTPNSTKPKA